MALTFGMDAHGPFITLECDMADCGAHEAARPGEPTDRLADALDFAYMLAADADERGWWTLGRLLCPGHALPGLAEMGLLAVPDAPGDPETVPQAVRPRAAAAVA